MVDNPDHGWLTKPLTLDDYPVLESLSPTTVKVLKLLYLGYTQAQIARTLRLSRQAVNKHVKKLLLLDIIRTRGSLHGAGKTKDVIYDVRKAVVVYFGLNKSRIDQDCQPQNKGGVSSSQKPLFTLHRLQLAFPIVTLSQPPSTSVRSFVKTYHPRGWTGYIFILGNVRIRVTPHKVIAELTSELHFDEPLTAEEALIRAIDQLKDAVAKWLEEQGAAGVEIELSHPYVMNAPEFAFKSKLIKKCIEKLREQSWRSCITNGHSLNYNQPNLSFWIDASPEKEGESEYGHIETNDAGVADILDSYFKNLGFIPALQEDIQMIKSELQRINLIEQEIQNVKVLIESGVPPKLQMEQLMSIVAYQIKEIAELRKENSELRKELKEIAELRKENSELRKELNELKKMLEARR